MQFLLDKLRKPILKGICLEVVFFQSCQFGYLKP